MGHQIIQQPDGHLCVWSTVVDDFIITDATADELADYYAKDAAAKARKDTKRLTEAVLAGRAREVYYQFTKTYDEATERRRSVHERLDEEAV